MFNALGGTFNKTYEMGEWVVFVELCELTLSHNSKDMMIVLQVLFISFSFYIRNRIWVLICKDKLMGLKLLFTFANYYYYFNEEIKSKKEGFSSNS